MTRFFHLVVLFVFAVIAPVTIWSQPTEETPEAPPAVELPTDSYLSDAPPIRDFGQEMMHMLMILGLLVAFLIGASWLLKRLFNQRIQNLNAGSSIKILERRALSAKGAVYLLEVEGHKVLLSESPSGLRRLADFPGSAGFREVFDAAREQESN